MELDDDGESWHKQCLIKTDDDWVRWASCLITWGSVHGSINEIKQDHEYVIRNLTHPTKEWLR